MSAIAIIGGSGLANLTDLESTRRQTIVTPYGETSAPLTQGRFHGKEIVFLPRHGSGHTIPPHRINYRANIWALNRIGVRKIVAVAAVGGITDGLEARSIVLPDQIIDYTYGRAHTFFDGEDGNVTHVDFTYPYCAELRGQLLAAAQRAGIHVNATGAYGATQGPRFETAGEIERMERDGADVVGMTGMPEAALARELDLRYATVAVVVNRAAGKEKNVISLKDIEAHLAAGMATVRRLLEHALPLIAAE